MNCQALNDKLPRIGLVRAKPAVDLSYPSGSSTLRQAGGESRKGSLSKLDKIYTEVTLQSRYAFRLEIGKFAN
jgi:hypothetical protein